MNRDFYKIVFDSFRRQIVFNTETNGKEWALGKTKDGREINWGLCVKSEVGEFIKALKTDHWRTYDTPVNVDELKSELADIYAFTLSDIMSRHMNLDIYNIQEAKHLLTDVSIYIDSYLKKHTFMYTSTAIDAKSVRYEGEDALNLTLLNRQIDYFLRDGHVLCPLVSLMTIAEMIPGFDRYKLLLTYFGKMTLNEVRQENGYGEGQYEKMWDGKSDESYMMAFIEDLEIEEALTNFGELDGLKEYLNITYHSRIRSTPDTNCPYEDERCG